LCPDGTPFVFEVSAASFSDTTQAKADEAAEAYACAQASARMICLSALSNAVFVEGTPFSATITAAGQSLAGPGQTNLWQMVSGSLPTGLTFNGGALASNQVTITGTPTETGTFTFGVSVTDPLGDTVTKFYTLNCPTGYTVTGNTYTYASINGSNCAVTHGTLTGFVPGIPDAGYDTQFFTPNNACGKSGTCLGGSASTGVAQTNDFGLTFTSGLLKTWNIKVIMTLGGDVAATQYSLTINGAVQSGWTVVGNVATWVGTFTTQNCANTTVAIHGEGDALYTGGTNYNIGCCSTVVEWATPA
jgi:hypothetical protein